uniref:Uncharacterized protein n=1 Tax=Chromera velia CCMP2878 TaxID=1169474 RepID=A0A0G4H8W8_9ALVE|mmetsp:Transcript_30300/g.59551  ORF Transcript_30300/g.59551 Transcript_30300/m.59551 type:complete len:112 (-) Transcript_30300:635-970(-)|eukprot:Cvel_25148.t1-p1 / transcript=Cvel_25148.t1 / gene=Cvel_25148 / organism=Chromera_velia_CCMP2878 / gene_product=hypothetical protein / transcript_product=hypothetical protein / location=Cvel_scaffold2812:6422-6874(-) / protein_length=111 / sequence_SO=supercontig / SO=protein_coding / is_pseudo=false
MFRLTCVLRNQQRNDTRSRKTFFWLGSRRKQRGIARMDRAKNRQRLAFAFAGVDFYKVRNLGLGEVFGYFKSQPQWVKRDVFHQEMNTRPPVPSPWKHPKTYPVPRENAKG